MAWAKLGTTTLTSSADTITVSDMTVTKFKTLLAHTLDTGGEIYQGLRFNSDTTNDYAVRKSYNGGADATYTSVTQMQFMGNAFLADIFGVGYLVDINGEEKLFIGFSVSENAAGASTAPTREEQADKYIEGADITAFNLNNTSAGDYNTNSNLSALGGDVTETVTLQNGTIFEETDTNKAYIWNSSTKTWTQL